MRLSSCNHTNLSALHAWMQTGVAKSCVLRRFTTAVLKADLEIGTGLRAATSTHGKAKSSRP